MRRMADDCIEYAQMEARRYYKLCMEEIVKLQERVRRLEEELP